MTPRQETDLNQLIREVILGSWLQGNSAGRDGITKPSEFVIDNATFEIVERIKQVMRTEASPTDCL